MIVDLLGRELTRSQRENVCTAVILGDLDDFKNINDTYGHLLGDQVLREVARRLLLSVRSYDFVGRYGGEEFLTVLNNCRPDSAVARAEQISQVHLHSPRAHRCWSAGSHHEFGSASSLRLGQRPTEDLINQADSALYEAKAEGRNRVKLATPDERAEAVIAAHTSAEHLR